MNVMLINGSPNAKGCTFTALSEVAGTLNREGVQTQMFQIGTKPLSGCLDCYKCKETGRCVINDKVNEFLNKARNADGFVFGTPVHYSAATGPMTCFMHRAFFANRCHGGDIFYLKPTAGVVSARRSGATTALNQLNEYFTHAEMLVVGSKYWNMVYGMNPEEVRHDLEGLQTMRVLARNMSWLLRCKQAALNAGVALPERENRIATNFIR